jgi:PAS domain S-box-containing protein
MSILVVDDHAESRTLVTEILSAQGFRVRAAGAGELPLPSLAVQQPALILLDLQMPGMDGFEVCRRLKASEVSREIPVIILSARGESADRVEGLRLGAVDYITKPFQAEELVARVRTHLELSRLRLDLEKRVAERTAQLRESEERFRTMADAAPMMIWLAGVDKLCTFFNQVWLEFTGRSMAEELGNGWAELVHAEDLERCMATFRSAFDLREPFEMEYRLRRADGEYRWVLDRGMPRFSPAGTFSGYVGTTVDITDLKQNHARMLASQKLESLGVMAAGVAHDFGNLLGTILAEADLALSEMASGAPGRENVEEIGTVATRASEIVKLLMASAGAKSGSEALAPVDLSAEVEQMLRLLKVSISKLAVVHTNLGKDLPPVRANVAQIHQVIINLVTNASEALDGKAGCILVTTDTASLAEHDIDSFRVTPGDYVRLTVADTGCGMTAETRARIFDQFFTTKSTGRGLGLAAVHGIVRSHGGAVNIESAPSKGATFEVLFPIAREAKTLSSGSMG